VILLVLGLVLFLGVHSIRIFAEDKRTAFIEARGSGTYSIVYSLLSLAGLVVLIFGYGQTRISPVFLWQPPLFLSHIASLLVLIAFILLAAAYVPGNRIKARVGHPMVLGVKVWAFAHLLANGRLGDVVLFGSFLAWAIADYIVAKKRDRLAGTNPQATGGIGQDAVVIVIGIAAWLVFAMWLHLRLIGVSPFGA
jgi:uncharacterized membrane protein